MAALDALAVDYFLSTYGHHPLTREVTVEVEDVTRAEVAEAITALDRTITGLDPRDAAYVATMTTAAQRKAELLDRLDALPSGRQTIVRTEDTGQTMADAWESAGTDERRALLLANLRVMVGLAERVPGTGRYSTDLAGRVDLLDPEQYAAMMGDPSAAAAAELHDER